MNRTLYETEDLARDTQEPLSAWRDEVVTREEILDYVWGYDVYQSTRTVDNLIVQLRKLLEPHPHEPIYLHTIRGVGYRFTAAGRRLE